MWFSLDQVDVRYVPPLRIRPSFASELESKFVRRSQVLGEVFYQHHFQLVSNLSQRGFHEGEKGEYAFKVAVESCWVPINRMRFWDEPRAPDPKPIPITNVDAFVRTRCTYARIKTFRKFSPNFSSVEKKVRELVSVSDSLNLTDSDGSTAARVVSLRPVNTAAGSLSPKLAGWIADPSRLTGETTGQEELSESLVLSVLAESNGSIPLSTLVGLLSAALPGLELIQTVSSESSPAAAESRSPSLAPDQSVLLREEYKNSKGLLARLNIDELRTVFLSVPEGGSGCPLELALVSEQESIESLDLLLQVRDGQTQEWLDAILAARQRDGVSAINAAFVGNLLGITPQLVTSRLKEARKKLRNA